MRWRTPIGSGYSGPAVAAGRIFTMERSISTNGADVERVLCVDEADGKRLWVHPWNELGDLIIAKLGPSGYEEISRAHLLEPTNRDAGRMVVWSHPAFANKSMFARNDKELIRVDLAAP